MRKTRSVMLVAVVAVLLYACDFCGSRECNTNDYSGSFRMVRATDGADLLYGANSVYDKALIKFYAVNGNDTTFFRSTPGAYSTAGADSFLQVDFFPKAETAYMRLPNGDIDTFPITYKANKTRCCGTLTEVEKFRYNNAVDYPGGFTIQTLRK